MIQSIAAIALGTLGAGAALALGAPMPLLTGPAILVAVAGVAGVPLRAHPQLRESVFLVLGIGIGAGVTPAAVDAVGTWPAAFVALPLLLLAMMLGGRWLLARGFGFDRRGALLACAPGHLSFVFALGESLGLRSDRIVLVQSIRLMMLSLFVPFAAAFGGIEMTGALSPGAPMGWGVFALLLALSLLAVPLLQWLAVPAPMMIAGLAVSSLAHGSGAVEGALHPWIATPAMVVVGALIGSRFVGVRLMDLLRMAAAGSASTVLAVALCFGAALVVAPIVQMPLLHVMVGFAPGGLQTMVIIGAAMGANPAFVAALHVARLMILSALIPLMVRRS